MGVGADLKFLTFLLLEVVGQAVVLQHSKVFAHWKKKKERGDKLKSTEILKMCFTNCFFIQTNLLSLRRQRYKDPYLTFTVSGV